MERHCLEIRGQLQEQSLESPIIYSKILVYLPSSIKPRLSFSQTHKVGNNGINANFVFPHSYSFLHYLYLKVFSKCEIRFQVIKDITFQSCRLY